jgi:hypothetical protein
MGVMLKSFLDLDTSGVTTDSISCHVNLVCYEYPTIRDNYSPSTLS